MPISILVTRCCWGLIPLNVTLTSSSIVPLLPCIFYVFPLFIRDNHFGSTGRKAHRGSIVSRHWGVTQHNNPTRTQDRNFSHSQWRKYGLNYKIISCNVLDVPVPSNPLWLNLTAHCPGCHDFQSFPCILTVPGFPTSSRPPQLPNMKSCDLENNQR